MFDHHPLSTQSLICGGTPVEELQRHRDKIYQHWHQNQRDYTTRYGNSPANYSASLADDYNGDGDEFTHLTWLLQLIDAELERRRQETQDSTDMER